MWPNSDIPLALLGVAAVCVMLAAPLVGFIRSGARIWRRAPFASRLAIAIFVVAAIRYGGAKNGATNEPDRVSNPAALRDDGAQSPRSGGDGCWTNAALRIDGFVPGTNTMSIAFAWTTNFSPDKVWIEVYCKAHSLTNAWLPVASEAMELGATNAAVSVAATNASAAFYTGRIDTLGIDAPASLSYGRPDGSRLFVSMGSLTVPVSIRRSARGQEFPPPDGAVPADPFADVVGLTLDQGGTSVTASGYGSYDLPDGGTLLVLKQPRVTFGVRHAYPGRTASYDAASGEYRMESPYPLDSRALWRSFRRGSTPTTGCSCVPEVDYGGGLAASASNTQGIRSGSKGQSGFPPGVTTSFDYVDGGVWASLLYGTNVIWRGWCSHDSSPEDDGEPEEDKDEDCSCSCGDLDSVEGPSLGSVRFRIPLGSPQSGEISGFLYVSRHDVFSPSPAAFSVLSRADAHVEDFSNGGVRVVSCLDAGGRTLVLSRTGADDEVEILVRDTASGAHLHTWYVARDDRPSIRFTKVSVLGNVIVDKSYSPASGCWRETDELSGREDRHEAYTMGLAGEWVREEDKVLLGGVVSRHVANGYDFIGDGASRVVRMTVRRELGADGAWKTNSYSYWSDSAHSNRHGRVRMERGDGVAWSWRAYDDVGRETFRLDQRNGSPAPLDRTDYAIGALGGVSCAFATECGYEPLPGDSVRSNDWDRVRVETRYAVEDGAATPIARTWTRYEHGLTNVWPVVRTTRIRACSANASMSDPGNEVTVEERYDDRSGLVPYVLRGALVSSIGSDGMATACEHAVSNGVFVCTTRRYYPSQAQQLPTCETTETDPHGNVLRRTTNLSDGGAVVFDERMLYDEKNRLRSTAYPDGTFETNAYSCCRLLWSQDRSGARRVRHAQTGTDHLRHVFVETAVAELPKDPLFYYGPWNLPMFKRYSPATRHCFDGMGRETNVVVSTGRLDGDTLHFATAAGGLVAESSTSFPQGVSDVSETVGFRGLRTRRASLPSQHAETTVEEEFEPGGESPSSAVTNVAVRGGGSVSWRGRPGKWTCEHRFSEYLADGCRTDYAVTESSDNGIVTNSVSAYDFLGRLVSVATPVGDTAYTYDGSSPRLVSSTYTAGDVVRSTQYVYNSFGERVGETVDGVTSRADVAYETDVSNVVWRVETRTASADGVTNSCSQTRTRLNGLSDAVRSEVVEIRDGAEVSRTLVSYDTAAGTERETVSNAVDGVSWTVRKLGYPISVGIPGCVTTNFYAPTGKIYTQWRTFPGGIPFPCEAVMTDALGDEIGRVVCDRYWLNDAPMSFRGYDCRGNLGWTMDPLENETYYDFDPDGNVEHEFGATHPVGYAYNTAGRRVAMATTRTGESDDVTLWSYDAATGLCTSKTYADGSMAAYTHTPDGLPLRTAFASGRWKENSYDARRSLSGVCHSDPSLDFEIARDLFGRVTNVVDAAGGEWRYEYGTGDTLLHEETVSDVATTQTTNSLSRMFDAYARPTGHTLSVDGVAKGGVDYAYGVGDGLLSNVTATNSTGREFAVEYTNIAGRNCGYVVTTPGGSVIRRNVGRDGSRRDLINSCSTTFNGSVVDSHTYTYDALSRPTARTSGGVASTFAYNERSEVVSAQIGTSHFAHAYDFIGNQTNFVANSITNIYTHNSLNQIEASQTTSALSAPLREICYDLDGNLTNDCIFAYSYDAANRLASVSSAALTNGSFRVSSGYDYRNRRTRKTVHRYVGGWQTTELRTFVYDNWNLIHETVSTVSGATTNTTEIQYFWGMDLSETLQGAGGVGGLLAVSINGLFYFPSYDNNGNVTKYIDESGNVVAAYEYDDFGRTIAQSGPMTEDFHIRFSTKYYDSETGLYYYGYRFYSPALMRWLNRDPIGERGGLNLYLAVANSPVLFIDALGFYRLIYHKFGTPPQGGWKREIDAAFKATFRFPQVFMLGYPQGKIGYRVDFHPQESVFEIFLRESFTFDAINDELDHVNCAIIYDTALGVFKDEVEKIIACPNVAQQKYDAAKSKLQAAEKKCKQCNDALDAKDGPHGH